MHPREGVTVEVGGMLPAHRTPTTQGHLGKLASQRTVSILLAINQPHSAANKPSVQRGGIHSG